MGVPGMWELYLKARKAVPQNIVQHIHNMNWTLGVDVPIAVRHRWHAGKEATDCVTSIIQQHTSLTTLSEQNPHPIKQIKYVFDSPHRNPLKVHEHKRREDARKRTRDNYEARQSVLSMVENGVTEIPAQLKRVNVVDKLLGKHTSIVVDEATSAVSLKTDLEAVAEDIRKRHKLDQPVVKPLLEGPNGQQVGIAPPKSEDEHRDRPPTDIYVQLMDEFDKRGIPYEISPDEAEHLLAAQCRRGEIDVVVTVDSDALLFGAPRVLKNFNPYGTEPTDNQLVELPEVLQALDITREQLVDIGVMAGCDFTEAHLPGFGVRTAYKEIVKCGSLEGVLTQSKGRAAHMTLKRDGLGFDYQSARDMFFADDVAPLPKEAARAAYSSLTTLSNVEAQLREPLYTCLADVRKWNAGLYAQVEQLVSMLDECLADAQKPSTAWHTIEYRHTDEPDCVGLILGDKTATIMDSGHNVYTFMAPAGDGSVIVETDVHTFVDKILGYF